MNLFSPLLWVHISFPFPLFNPVSSIPKILIWFSLYLHFVRHFIGCSHKKTISKNLTFIRSWEKCCDRGNPRGNRCPDKGYLTQSVWARKASWRRWPLSNNWRKSISLVGGRRGKSFPGRGDSEHCWTQSLSIPSAFGPAQELSVSYLGSFNSLPPSTPVAT